jgi:hypothetical protein
VTRGEWLFSITIRLGVAVLFITALAWLGSLIADGCRPLRPAELKREEPKPEIIVS